MTVNWFSASGDLLFTTEFNDAEWAIICGAAALQETPVEQWLKNTMLREAERIVDIDESVE